MSEPKPTNQPPMTAEQWWDRFAVILSEKMKAGGVKSFRIEMTERGTWAYEVVPVQEEQPQTGGAA